MYLNKKLQKVTVRTLYIDTLCRICAKREENIQSNTSNMYFLPEAIFVLLYFFSKIQYNTYQSGIKILTPFHNQQKTKLVSNLASHMKPDFQKTRAERSP